MDHKGVEKLELEIEEAIVEVVGRLGIRRLPLLPSHRTLQLMAKAAVTVYETAVENRVERSA